MKTSKTSADALIFQPASSMTFTVNYRTTKDRAVLRSKYKFLLVFVSLNVLTEHVIPDESTLTEPLVERLDLFKGRVDSEILPDEHVLSHYIVIYRDLISDMASETKIKIHLIMVTKYRRKVLVDGVMNRIIEIIKEEMPKRKCEVIAI